MNPSRLIDGVTGGAACGLDQIRATAISAETGGPGLRNRASHATLQHTPHLTATHQHTHTPHSNTPTHTHLTASPHGNTLQQTHTSQRHRTATHSNTHAGPSITARQQKKACAGGEKESRPFQTLVLPQEEGGRPALSSTCYNLPAVRVNRDGERGGRVRESGHPPKPSAGGDPRVWGRDGIVHWGRIYNRDATANG